jgi:uncharacterized membrane protein
MFIIPLTAGPILILAGTILMRYAPPEINPLFGYRTKLSMRSEEAWLFAQQFSGKQLILFGCLLTVSSVTGLIAEASVVVGTVVGVSLVVLFATLPLVITESKLKSRFKKKISVKGDKY